MGYRFYFGSIDRSAIDTLNEYTLDELKEKHGNEYHTIFFFDLMDFFEMEEAFFLGEFTIDDLEEQLHSMGKPLFSNQEIQNEFIDEQPIIVGKEGLLKAIEYFRGKIVRFLETFFTESGTLIEKRVQSDMEQRLFAWKYLPLINLSEEESNTVSNSSQFEYEFFEYEIFNLVHLLKTIDWEYETLLFYRC